MLAEIPRFEKTYKFTIEPIGDLFLGKRVVESGIFPFFVSWEQAQHELENIYVITYSDLDKVLKLIVVT